MLTTNYIQNLIGLKDTIVKDLIQENSSTHIYIELPITKYHCPDCHQPTTFVHDYRSQIIKDDVAFSKFIYLHYRKRRYRCSHCNKRFLKRTLFFLSTTV